MKFEQPSTPSPEEMAEIIKPQKTGESSQGEKILEDYPLDLREEIKERGNLMITLNEDMTKFFRNLANEIENRKLVEGEDPKKNFLEAKNIIDALDAELGLRDISPEERIKGENYLLETLERLAPKQLLLEKLSRAATPEEKKNIEKDILYHEGMAEFLRERKNIFSEKIEQRNMGQREGKLKRFFGTVKEIMRDMFSSDLNPKYRESIQKASWEGAIRHMLTKGHLKDRKGVDAKEELKKLKKLGLDEYLRSKGGAEEYFRWAHTSTPEEQEQDTIYFEIPGHKELEETHSSSDKIAEEVEIKELEKQKTGEKIKEVREKIQNLEREKKSE